MLFNKSYVIRIRTRRKNMPSVAEVRAGIDSAIQKENEAAGASLALQTTVAEDQGAYETTISEGMKKVGGFMGAIATKYAEIQELTGLADTEITSLMGAAAARKDGGGKLTNDIGAIKDPADKGYDALFTVLHGTSGAVKAVEVMKGTATAVKKTPETLAGSANELSTALGGAVAALSNAKTEIKGIGTAVAAAEQQTSTAQDAVAGVIPANVKVAEQAGNLRAEAGQVPPLVEALTQAARTYSAVL
jgi:uncharacterized protein YoxC